MAAGRENFNLTGPKQLADVDWTNHHHRRAVAASLVQGAYNLEHNRRDPQVQPSGGWNSFHFQLKRALIDNKDSSIYGAVYEIENTYLNNLPKCAPKYVIAFRGTILKLRTTVIRDIKLDIKLLIDVLHMDKHRFEPALDAVQQVVQEAGSTNIWLAGHSQGSSIAMIIGKSMAQQGNCMETFLFNPPFLGPALLEMISSQYLGDAVRFASTLFNVGTLLVGGRRLRQRQYDQVNALSSWIPNLFVNRHDPICSEYIGHFRNRNKMEKIGAGMMGSVAALNTGLSIFKPAVGIQLPIPLLPKANLTISENSSKCNLFEAHGLKQWWDQMSIGLNSTRKVSIGDPVLVGGP